MSMLEKRKIPDPNGSRGRVEGLVIGLFPALGMVGSITAAVVVASAAYFSLAAKHD